MGKLRAFSFERLLRTLHGWLGFLVMPWIVAIGLSGIYLNHSQTIFPYLPNGSFDEKQFDDWPDPAVVSMADAKAVAAGVWPDVQLSESNKTRYHGRDVHILKSKTGKIIVDHKTGHYWVKKRFVRDTFDPDGRLLSRKYYWGTVLKTVHRSGWISDIFGTWLADIAAGAMVFFGLTGIFMFLTPRLRRRRNRKGRRVEVVTKNTPRPQRIKLKK